LFVSCDDRVTIPLGNPSPPRAVKKKKRDPGSEAGVTAREESGAPFTFTVRFE